MKKLKIKTRLKDSGQQEDSRHLWKEDFGHPRWKDFQYLEEEDLR